MPILVHEQLVVTQAIRGLILRGAEADVIHRQAIADGMRSLRQSGLDLVNLTSKTIMRAGRSGSEATRAPRGSPVGRGRCR